MGRSCEVLGNMLSPWKQISKEHEHRPYPDDIYSCERRFLPKHDITRRQKQTLSRKAKPPNHGSRGETRPGGKATHRSLISSALCLDHKDSPFLGEGGIT